MTTKLLMAAGLSVGIFIGASCRSSQPDHCGSLNGDVTCAEEGGGQYCNTCDVSDDANNGCTDTLPSVDCRYEGTAGTGTGTGGDDGMPTDDGSADEESGDQTTNGVETSDGDSTEDDGDDSTTGADGCTTNAQCTDGGAPFCDEESGECVACSGMNDPDAACARLGAGTDVCNKDECVQCTAENAAACDGNTPVCGGSTCRECVEHSECPDSACKIRGSLADQGEDDYGSCFAVGDVETATAAQVPALLSGLGAGEELVVLLSDSGTFFASPLLAGDQRVAIVGDPQAPPTWDDAEANQSQLDVRGGTRVWLHGLNIANNTSSVVTAVSTEDAGTRLHVQRSRITTNLGGALEVADQSQVHLENAMLTGAADVRTLYVSDASISLLYTSVLGGLGNANALDCLAPQTVEVRNSIILTRGSEPANECAGVVPETSTVHDGATTNPNFSTWFVNYNSTADLLPAGVAEFSDVATWNEGDPLVDIEGTARPDVSGTADVAGAHLGG